MTTYKYINDTVVAVIDDDGLSRMSMLATSVPDGVTIEPADAVPEPVPESITFAQLLIGLVTEAWITQPEGEAWLLGTLPSAVETLITSLPTNQQFIARARATRPSAIYRADSLVAALAYAEGKSATEIDDFFRTYALV